MSYLINGDYKDVKIKELFGEVNLFIVDPPYGRIVSDSYDRISPKELVNELIRLFYWISKYAKKGATVYCFGGIGTYRNRPFFEFLSRIEFESDFRIHNFLTWKKRRGYGAKYNYMYAREEIAMFVYDDKKPNCFNIPLLNNERSDEWKKRLEKQKYKPKSDRMRRSNVFTDINEIFRNQHKNSNLLVSAQKPEKLIQVLVETSSNLGDIVIDPMAGSGTTAVVCSELCRKFVCIERDTEVFNIIQKRINK